MGLLGSVFGGLTGGGGKGLLGNLLNIGGGSGGGKGMLGGMMGGGQASPSTIGANAASPKGMALANTNSMGLGGSMGGHGGLLTRMFGGNSQGGGGLLTRAFSGGVGGNTSPTGMGGNMPEAAFGGQSGGFGRSNPTGMIPQYGMQATSGFGKNPAGIAPHGLGGTNSQFTPQTGGSTTQIAKSYLGQPSNSTALQSFMQKSSGSNYINPTQNAWCAEFANSVVKTAGYPTTGSNMAQSFMKWGTPTSSPSNGDIVVFSRGAKDSGLGHVGFFEGMNKDGTINVLGGNQGGQVSMKSYPTDRVLGYRSPPSSPEQAHTILQGAFQNKNSMVPTQNSSTGLTSSPTQVSKSGMKQGLSNFMDEAKQSSLNPISSAEARPMSGIQPQSNHFGDIMAKYESGNGVKTDNWGAATKDPGDPGGRSYGRYQFDTNTGTVARFIKTQGYSDQFAGLKPDTPAFNAKWKSMASDPNFQQAQTKFEQSEYLGPMQKAATKLGLNLPNTPAMNETLMSLGNQMGNGGGTKVLRNAGIQPGDNEQTMIQKIYDSRNTYSHGRFASRYGPEAKDLIAISKNPVQNMAQGGPDNY